MKRLILTLIVIIILIAMIGADIRGNQYKKSPKMYKKPCIGYTIIEFGKGISCNGDTVKLMKVGGGQILVR